MLMTVELLPTYRVYRISLSVWGQCCLHTAFTEHALSQEDNFDDSRVDAYILSRTCLTVWGQFRWRPLPYEDNFNDSRVDALDDCRSVEVTPPIQHLTIHLKDKVQSSGYMNYNDKYFGYTVQIQGKTRHVFEKRGCPRRKKSQTMANICKSYILNPPPQGYVMSVKCAQPLDELTVQVWLLYDHPNFKYCTLFISGTELRTDKRTNRRKDGWTDGQTDGRTIQKLDGPRGPFMPGA